MNLFQIFLTENACYEQGIKQTVKMLMLHSTAANNTRISRYVQPDNGQIGTNPYGNHWNQPYPGGRAVCVHGFIGTLKDGSVATCQTLPWDMRSWHAGGLANRMGSIGIEICEDDRTDPVYFAKVYREAVELFAHLCMIFDLDPLKDGVIIDHSEGYKRKIASNHSDVGHWFPKHGKSMDTFRADVAAELKRLQTPAPAPEDADDDTPILYYVQTGAYRVKSYADDQYRKVKAAGFEAIIKQLDDLYRVQVGAFYNREYAETLAEKLKAAGFDTYITTTGGKQVPVTVKAQAAAEPAKVLRSGSKVLLKTSASKYYSGVPIPARVKGKTYTVQQVKPGRVLLKEILSWVKVEDVILQ